MARTDLIREAFNKPDEVHAGVRGVYAGLKYPHRFPNAPGDTDEGHYWKFGVLVAKGILVTAAVITTYTQLGPF